ncbi:type IV pilus twitching motility protein PilT [Cohnella sp. REN36]|uniref:type IV pilus twitching motility protein PilT n=1 Tax=Cohnella sp. REN36 TaxID=2887347 RepID=UPI001D15DDD9|nr:type IV pilus twitching motility protein PilT [Cohnella sp. REN36]MCC3374615.1 type IV pilus twitching motility protein PilT [Cohnella sp. REN36]
MDTPHSRMLSLLREAHERGASDLHLSAAAPPMLRVNGVLEPAAAEPIAAADVYAMALSLIGEAQAERFERAGELDFSYELDGVSRFRINAYRQRGKASVAIRAIPAAVPTLEQLRLPPVLGTFAAKPQGLVLVTGPTGSGKSSTLAAMIHRINTTECKHIVTLEDPIEYVHGHGTCIIDQREVGSDTQSFASGLRAALRQDPDVILVGEMRDPETISAAVTAAETGHLVFATLHTTDAPQTIDRIIDAYPGHQQGQIRAQLAAVLVAVVSQRLLPGPQGRGRACATEILVHTPAVANLIRTEKTYQIKSLMQTGRQFGMHTLETSIKELLVAGLVDAGSARAYLAEGGV